MKSRKDKLFFPKHSSFRTSAFGRITWGSHITYYSLVFFIARALKGQVHVLIYRTSENCKSLVLQDMCNIEIFLSPVWFNSCPTSHPIPSTTTLCDPSNIRAATGQVGQPVTCLTAECRYMSDCRSRGREFDPGPVPYFRGDWSWNNFYGHSPPFRWFKKGCCQLQAKVCARRTG